MDASIKRNYIIIGLVFITVLLIGGVLAWQFVFREKTFAEIMEEDAKQINAHCPSMLDSETRLDQALFVPDNTFQYSYTMVNMEKDSVDIPSLFSRAEEPVTEAARTDPKLQAYRDHQVTLAFIYNDKKGSLLFKVMVTPDKYK